MRHSVNISRYLHFISDFLHLIICLKNIFISNGFLLLEGKACPEFIKAAFKEDNCNTTLKSHAKIIFFSSQPK